MYSHDCDVEFAHPSIAAKRSRGTRSAQSRRDQLHAFGGQFSWGRSRSICSRCSRRHHGAVADLARDILHTGPAGLGFLRMRRAMGAALVAFTLARWQLHRTPGKSMFALVPRCTSLPRSCSACRAIS